MHICGQTFRRVQKIRVTSTHNYQDFLHRDFFTLAIGSYKVFSATVLVTPWGSTNKVQCRADNGSRYVRLLSCFICK